MHHDVVVAVPRDALAIVDLHHADAMLHQPPRHQTTSSEFAVAVSSSRGLTLLADIEYLRSLRLHPKSNFHQFNARLELRLVADTPKIRMVQLVEKLQLLLLLRRAEDFVANAFDQFLGIGLVIGDMSSLIGIRQ